MNELEPWKWAEHDLLVIIVAKRGVCVVCWLYNINKFQANRRKSLLQLRGEVLGWVAVVVAVGIAAAAAARIAVQVHRQHFE
jgi:hypothetical protein